MGDDGNFDAAIRRIRAGDETAAAELVRRYEQLIRREVRLHLEDDRLRRLFDSMDVVQSVLASFFIRTAAGEYDLDRPEQLAALLVQMTRKKLGLGLLESFSEPCEVCAGRGIIVHHEPIMKHRAPQQVERRRGRGGNQQQPAAESKAHAGTHAITEDVSKALATIAAKTVHHEVEVTVETPAAAATAEAPATESASTKAEATTDVAPDTAVADKAAAPAEQVVEILDIPIPVTKKPRTRRAVDPSAAEQLLGSVLESLPEPPAPGTRKRATRRATTGTITAAPMTTADTDKG